MPIASATQLDELPGQACADRSGAGALGRRVGRTSRAGRCRRSAAGQLAGPSVGIDGGIGHRCRPDGSRKSELPAARGIGSTLCGSRRRLSVRCGPWPNRWFLPAARPEKSLTSHVSYLGSVGMLGGLNAAGVAITAYRLDGQAAAGFWPSITLGSGESFRFDRRRRREHGGPHDFGIGHQPGSGDRAGPIAGRRRRTGLGGLGHVCRGGRGRRHRIRRSRVTRPIGTTDARGG